MKLYRYRPLNDFLFKELLYNELYFASPEELNDPLDLNGQLNFYTENEDKIRGLIYFLSKEMMMWALSSEQYNLVKEIQKIQGSEKFRLSLLECFSSFNVKKVSKDNFYEVLSTLLQTYLPESGFKKLNINGFFMALDKTISQFFTNSSVLCFSESCSEFLMWSHYASSHTGICLEFEVEKVENKFMFPMTIYKPEYNSQEEIVFRSEVKKVSYPKEMKNLNIYNFLHVLNNKEDCDVVNLSKARWHGYADEIENAFLQKLSPWADENEWRIVHVEFKKSFPEERILSYYNNLTGIYFGAKLSQQTRKRIKNIFKTKEGNTRFYNCIVDGTKGVVINTE